MPTYTYQCKKCGEIFDEEHKMSDSDGDQIKCTECGNVGCIKIISGCNLGGDSEGAGNKTCSGGCAGCSGCGN